MKIALAGNPNSGKTTMYNALTGSSEKVGNWAGVTVDKREHLLKKTYSKETGVTVVDLPGTYSLSPFTSEENVTTDYIKNERPDVIINIVDATNLSRSLFFTTQLLELDIPVVVALNKTDINDKKHTEIDEKLLSEKLNAKVVSTVSTSNEGLKKLIDCALSVVGSKQQPPYVQEKVESLTKKEVDILDRKRFEFVNKIVKSVEKRKVFSKNINRQDKFDRVITNTFVGLLLFMVVMFLVFGISQAWLGPWISDVFVGWLEIGKDYIASLLANESGELGIWSSILVDGVIGGLIAVISFLPLVMIMYFLIALLEDCGYMARASIVLDPIFKKVGLSGKSIIPFIIGTGCSIPGVMACRTIKDERERRATAMLTPFMPCGAKLPVIALFAGVFFNKSPWVGVTMYFVGILLILLGALLIKLITGSKKRSYFVIELPEYKIPSILGATKSMLSRGWAYVVKAGTIILVCNFVVHLMQNFNWNFEVVESPEDSILHTFATPFAYLIAPVVGIVSWKLAAACVTGLIAKENIVGTLAVCFGITNFINVEELVLESGATEVAEIFGITAIAGLSFLMFNLFIPPCFAAIGAMNAEIKSRKWFFAGIGLQFAVGFTVSFMVYFFGSVITGANLTLWMSVLGWAMIAVFVAIITVLILKNRENLKKAV